jgi:hypothetical protein
LDTRSFYMLFSERLRRVEWDRHGDYEYVLVGDGIRMDISRLQGLIESTFDSERLCFAFSRRVAIAVPRSEAVNWIAQRALGKKGSVVADEGLRTFLDVQAIGVARTGTARPN